MQVRIDRVSDCKVQMFVYFRGKEIGRVVVNATELPDGRRDRIVGNMEILKSAHFISEITPENYYD